MNSLQEVVWLSKVIDSFPSKTLKVFYRLIFGNDCGRLNRKRLKEFGGFNLDDEKLKNKISHVSNCFTKEEISLIFTILSPVFKGEATVDKVCTILNNLSLFPIEIDEETESDEDESPEEAEDQLDPDINSPICDRFKELLTLNKTNITSLNSTRRPEFEWNKRSEYENNGKTINKFNLSFKDVEDSILTYSGDDIISVEHWINTFEENALLFGWNDLQKLIFAKRKLLGLAKLFIQSEKGLTTWESLREALLKEFSKRLNSAELHRMLAERKKHRLESCEEYYLIMKEMASRGNIEAEAVIHYIIEGIVDSMSNKVVLYGANNFHDFKEKLKIYSLIKAKSNMNFSVSDKSKILGSRSGHVKEYPNKKTEPQIRCYSCGEIGHLATRCPDKDKGAKCYRCDNFGHLANACTTAGKIQDKLKYDTNVEKESYSTTAAPDKVMTINNTDMMKRICVGDTEFDCLIDTGSDVNLINSDSYFKIAEHVIFTNSVIHLKGLGGNKVSSLGKVEAKIILDGNNYNSCFYVVPNFCMKPEILLGKELLSIINLTINKGKISFINELKDELHRAIIGQRSKRHEIKKLQDQIQTKELQINKMNEQEKSYAHQLDELRKELATTKELLENTLDRSKEKKYTKKIMSYSGQLEKLKIQKENSLQKIESLQSEINWLKDEFNKEELNRKRQAEEYIEFHDNEVAKLNREYQGLKDKELEWSNKTEEILNENDEIKQLYFELRASNDKLLKKLEQESLQSSKYLTERDELKVTIGKLKEDMARLENQVLESNEAKRKLENEIVNTIKGSNDSTQKNVQNELESPLNGQVERIVQVAIDCLKKMSTGNVKEWYKQVLRLQRALNSTHQRSIATTPFTLLFGVKMRRPEDLELLQMIDIESREVSCDEREQLRAEAERSIGMVQDEEETEVQDDDEGDGDEDGEKLEDDAESSFEVATLDSGETKSDDEDEDVEVVEEEEGNIEDGDEEGVDDECEVEADIDEAENDDEDGDDVDEEDNNEVKEEDEVEDEEEGARTI